MKKRLLITSIVMMLVVAVALSTATYAWFTSNATATATSITMKATTSTAPALGISWIDGNYGTEINPVITDYATTETYVFSPVAPATLSKTGTITDSTVVFNTSTTYSSAGDFKFGANGAAAPAQATYTLTDGSGHTSFFLKNLSTANALTGTLSMSATITGTGADLIRVGVFVYNSTSEKYELVEVLANQAAGYNAVAENTVMDNATTYYMFVNGQYVAATKGADAASLEAGANWYPDMPAPAGKFYTLSGSQVAATAVYGNIVKDASVNAMSTYNCATSYSFGTNLAASTVIEVKVIVWMDAAALGDNQQGNVGSIVLNFVVA